MAGSHSIISLNTNLLSILNQTYLTIHLRRFMDQDKLHPSRISSLKCLSRDSVAIPVCIAIWKTDNYCCSLTIVLMVCAGLMPTICTPLLQHLEAHPSLTMSRRSCVTMRKESLKGVVAGPSLGVLLSSSATIALNCFSYQQIFSY